MTLELCQLHRQIKQSSLFTTSILMKYMIQEI